MSRSQFNSTAVRRLGDFKLFYFPLYRPSVDRKQLPDVFVESSCKPPSLSKLVTPSMPVKSCTYG